MKKSNKNMIKLFIILFVSIVLSSPIFSQNKSCITFNADYSKFHYNSEENLLEIYYFIYLNTHNLTFDNDININVNFEIFDSTDSLINQQNSNIQFNTSINKTSQGKIGQINKILPYGKYTLKITYETNPYSNEKDSIYYDINLEKYIKDEVCLSDIELCKNIIANSNKKNSPFYKNTMLVIPNPINKFGKEIPALFYYVELYNLISQKGKSLTIDAQIINTQGEIVKENSYKKEYNSSSAVERGVFAVNKLTNGKYTLKLSVKDEKLLNIDLKVREFYISGVNIPVAANGDLVKKNNLFLNNRFSEYTEKELDKIFEQSKYVASDNEKKVFSNFIDKKGKMHFLTKFWNDKNSLYGYEFENTYFGRIEYVNELYKASFKEGWQTERGRVYILYGPPNEIERPVLDEKSKVEIWFYNNIQGGIEFDFVDFSGFGDYNLLNSNHPKENNNPEWRSYLQ